MSENNFDFLKALDDLIIEHGENLETYKRTNAKRGSFFASPTIAKLGENGRETIIPMEPKE